MKRILAFLLVFTMLFALVACGGGDNTSKTEDNSTAVSTDSSKADSSKDEASKGETSKEETSKEVSEEVSKEVSDEVSDEVSGEASDEVSGDTSEDEVSGEPTVELPADTNKYVSFGQPNTEDRIDKSKSGKGNAVLTAYNEAPVYGSVVLYTPAYGATIPADADWSEYAILTATYTSAPLFGYIKSDYKAVGAGSAVAIPADGFVLVAHKDQESDIAAMESWDNSDTLYPHGIQVLDLDYTVGSTATAPTLDGIVEDGEYGAAIDRVDIDNDAWDYQQFAKDEDYDIVADIYATYDADYLYLAVVVEMDYHFCPDAGSMWNYCSVQLNVTTETPTSDYISENFDHVVNNKAMSEGKWTQYGYCVTDAGQSGSTVFIGKGKAGECMVVRNDATQTTTYEIKLSWVNDLMFAEGQSAGDSFGLSFSINCRDALDGDGGSWKNVRMRNGGGIIGRNDLSKMVTVTLN